MRQPAIPRFMLVEPGLTLYQWEQFLALGCRLSTWSRPIARASSSAGRRSAGEGVFLCSVLMAVCFCRDSWQVSRPAIPTQLHTLYSQAHVVSQGSPYRSRRAQGKLRSQHTWRLVPAAEKQAVFRAVAAPQFSVAGRLERASRATGEHIARSSGKSLPGGVSEDGLPGWPGLRETPRARFAFAGDAAAAAILMTP